MKRTLGHTGITTSTLALGCARLGSLLTPLDRSGGIALIERAMALGVQHFDTASIYGQGDSERWLGEALAGSRHLVCLSSKAGQTLSGKQAVLALAKGPLRWLVHRRPAVHQQVAAQRARGVPRCFEPDYITRSLQASLRRLRTDHLDIFYLHSPDATVLNDERLLSRLAKLKADGLFRALGVSCDDLPTAHVAAALPQVQVLQFGYDDSVSCAALVAEAERTGKVVILRGLMQPPDGARPSQAWLTERLAQTLTLPPLGGVIVGTTRQQHLRDNVAALNAALSQRVAA